MKKTKIKKQDFIERFNEINSEYKTITKNIKNLIKKSKKLLKDGDSLYIESYDKNDFIKPSFKSLPKMMYKLEEIENMEWYF